MRRTARPLIAAVTGIAAAALVALAVGGPNATGQVPAPTGQAGRYLLDAQGRAVILHGLNQVYKVAPYTPSADGFGDDDAAFLQANGFDAMRVGVIWAAVEPTPGHFDTAYLDSIASTVNTLAAHGIVSLLDFHQDMYNEVFQGEGAPAWAVLDGGLPNPRLGFPFNYFGNPAEEHAWDAFWKNTPVAGQGLQDHYAAAWQHVAARFAGNPAVLGYELLNEPWPGTVWEQCAVPVTGCPLFDATLTKFYVRVLSAIRSTDATTRVFVEPNVLFSEIDATALKPIADARLGFSFHDYCASAAEGLGTAPCPLLDGLTVKAAKAFATKRSLPWLMTEFGATANVTNLNEMVALADKNQLGWLEWAYTGNDITSTSSSGQAVVLDPSQPPTGANVVASTLKALAEPYPQAVAGTPGSWSWSGGVFRLTYTTARLGAAGTFPAGSETDIATPMTQFPAGYTVTVSGASVTSAPNATTLRVASLPGSTSVSVTVSPA